MKEIVIDTSLLLSQFEYSFDLPGELLRISPGAFCLIIPPPVLSEIEALSKKTGKRASYAKAALAGLSVIKKRLVVKIPHMPGYPPSADNWIFKYAQNKHPYVATNDSELRKKIAALGVPVISVKGKSKLDFV